MLPEPYVLLEYRNTVPGEGFGIKIYTQKLEDEVFLVIFGIDSQVAAKSALPCYWIFLHNRIVEQKCTYRMLKGLSLTNPGASISEFMNAFMSETILLLQVKITSLNREWE